jgi:hypothetical protein
MAGHKKQSALGVGPWPTANARRPCGVIIFVMMPPGTGGSGSRFPA